MKGALKGIRANTERSKRRCTMAQKLYINQKGTSKGQCILEMNITEKYRMHPLIVYAKETVDNSNASFVEIKKVAALNLRNCLEFRPSGCRLGHKI